MDTIAPAGSDIIDVAGHLTTAPGPLEQVMGGQSVRLVAFNGAGGWHKHDTASETVIVWRGTFDVEYHDRTVRLSAGQCTVIAPGQEHRGVSDSGAQIILLRSAEAG